MHPIDDTLPENIPTQSAALLNKQPPTAIERHGRLKQAQSESPGEADTASPFIGMSRGVAQQLWPVESRGAPK
jgi:hypothetical protein